MQGLRKMSVSIRAVTQHRCMPMWLWKQRLKPLAEFQIIFLTCTIRAEKCEIFSTRIFIITLFYMQLYVDYFFR